MIVMHCADYCAPYEGNFIKSLICLEKRIELLGGAVEYVFPIQAKNQPWWDSFSNNHKCHLTERKDSVKEMSQIIEQVNPTIVHTHFEGYDISTNKSIRKLKKINRIKQVWHLHDILNYQNNPLKALYQVYYFFMHYNWNSKNVSVIGVSSQIMDFVNCYKKISSSGFIRKTVIPNGVDFNRIKERTQYKRHQKFTFLSYGGRNMQKRVDLLMKAAEIVVKKYDIELLVTNGIDTQEVAHDVFHGDVPEWCRIISQQEDICGLLEQADCFVSSAVYETFSYAICESSVFGLPVIQSDIKGTIWNANNPSTFLFHSNDVDDLCRVMIEVITKSDEELEQVCLVTQKRNREEYSLDRWTYKVLEFYKSIL